MIIALLLLAAVAVNLPLNAGVLWLACRLLQIQRSAREVTYRRSLALVLAIFAAGWFSLCLAYASARPFSDLPPLELAFYVLIPLGVVVPLAILKPTLGVGWWRTLGVFVAWRVLTLAHAGPTAWLLRPYVAETLTP